MSRVPELVGKKVILTELEPKYFADVIRWRNNPELNKYINQPFTLTMELEEEWYRKTYLRDDTQVLFVMLDKDTGKPFGTMGYVDYDSDKHICISARLMAGEQEYQGSAQLIEGLLIFFDYVYHKLGVERIYSHVVIENKASLRLQKRLGLVPHDGEPYFPERLHDSSFPMVEIIGTPETFDAGRAKILKMLEGIL